MKEFLLMFVVVCAAKDSGDASCGVDKIMHPHCNRDLDLNGVNSKEYRIRIRPVRLIAEKNSSTRNALHGSFQEDITIRITIKDVYAPRFHPTCVCVDVFNVKKVLVRPKEPFYPITNISDDRDCQEDGWCTYCWHSDWFTTEKMRIKLEGALDEEVDRRIRNLFMRVCHRRHRGLECVYAGTLGCIIGFPMIFPP